MRTKGYVVGYDVKGKGATRTVSSSDVLVYPEVQFTKVGWVPFAPGPRDLQRGVPVVRKFKPPKTEQSPEPTQEPTQEPTPTPTPTPTEQPKDQSEATNLAVLLVPLVVVAAREWG